MEDPIAYKKMHNAKKTTQPGASEIKKSGSHKIRVLSSHPFGSGVYKRRSSKGQV